MFSSEIQGIKFVLVTSNEIEMTCNHLKVRYSVTKTAPGVRGFHQFIPVSQVTIKTKCVSEDEFCLEFNLTNETQMCIDTLRISQFIRCNYDHLYWVEMVCETDIKYRDVRVKFMHPSYQSRSYRWSV